MKITIECKAKEIAALVQELQERPARLGGSQSYTYDLIVENNQLRDVVRGVAASPNCDIRQD